jgi:hypothetical protein
VIASSADRRKYKPDEKSKPTYRTADLTEMETARLNELLSERTRHEAKIKELTTGPMIYGGIFTKPETTYRQHRGDPMQPREVVQPGALGIIPVKFDPASGTGVLPVRIETHGRDARATSAAPLASLREPSKITVGPEGSWTMRFDRLVQPLLDAQCVSCHNPDSKDVAAAKFNLTPNEAYKSLTLSGKPSLNDLVLAAYRDGVSTEGHAPAAQSSVLRLLADPAGHAGVKLDRADLDRFITWMDTYAQRAGTFSPEQEQELEGLRRAWAGMLIEPTVRLTAARGSE